ncbi:hypothetical protein D6C80_09884, partial [Aureobasidium pullulans]
VQRRTLTCDSPNIEIVLTRRRPTQLSHELKHGLQQLVFASQLIHLIITLSPGIVEVMRGYDNRTTRLAKAGWLKRQAPRQFVSGRKATSSAKTTTRQNMSSVPSNTLKRRRAGSKTKRTHHLSHIQQLPADTEPAAQDEAFIQAQLLRSICTALTIVGYESVKPSALEMFRAEVEEYMMNFLTTVKHSMTTSRRTTAIPQDFILALAEAGLESHHLEPHLQLRLPNDISNPIIPPPRPSEAPPPNLAPMLGQELATPATQQYGYIPSHFPPLPSRHAWQGTAVLTEREQDPRRIRERATDEGVQAEHALRKLTAANKARSRQAPVDKAKDKLWQDTISDLLDDEDKVPTQKDADGDLRLEGCMDSGERVSSTADLIREGGGLMVNHDRNHWRRGRGAVHI